MALLIAFALRLLPIVAIVVLRGQAGAALSMMAATTNVLSMGFVGLFGDIIGIRSVFVLSGVIVVLAGVVSAWVFSSETMRAPILHGEN